MRHDKHGHGLGQPMGWVGWFENLRWVKHQHFIILLWNWDSTVFPTVWICHISPVSYNYNYCTYL